MSEGIGGTRPGGAMPIEPRRSEVPKGKKTGVPWTEVAIAVGTVGIALIGFLGQLHGIPLGHIGCVPAYAPLYAGAGVFAILAETAAFAARRSKLVNDGDKAIREAGVQGPPPPSEPSAPSTRGSLPAPPAQPAPPEPPAPKQLTEEEMAEMRAKLVKEGMIDPATGFPPVSDLSTSPPGISLPWDEEGATITNRQQFIDSQGYHHLDIWVTRSVKYIADPQPRVVEEHYHLYGYDLTTGKCDGYAQIIERTEAERGDMGEFLLSYKRNRGIE